MKALLFDPPYERLMGIKTTLVYPLGLSYLAATLNSAAHEAIYINFDYDRNLPIVNPFSRVVNMNNYQRYSREVTNDSNPVWNSLRQLILKYSPQVVGISCTSIKMRSALMMAKIIKEINSDIIVIIGGHHPMLYAKEILQNSLDIDVIALGEFDLGLVEIVNAIQDNVGTLYEKLCGIPGIYIRDRQNKVMKTRDRELIQSLDKLPYPESAYYFQNSNTEILPLTSIVASRGCPYRCAYCATTNIWGRKVRFRSPENVLDEIKYRIRIHNVRNFSFLTTVLL